MKQTSRLIESILGNARQQGLTAKDVAQRAGIEPANLARVRKTGRFSADTLERLLGALNCEFEVVFRPMEEPRTLAFVQSKLNAGRKKKLSLEELRKHLTKFRASKAAEQAFSHLVGIIEEVPLEQIHDLVRQNDATLASLLRIAKYVEAEGETVEWIRDQVTA